MNFLNKIAEIILSEMGADMSSCTIIFPSKRASLFFKEELKNKASEKEIDNLLMPKLKVINEFFSSFSKKIIPHETDLIFYLYQAYIEAYYGKKIEQITIEDKVISFADFYPFGEMVLNDFQEIDNYDIKPENIFCDLDTLQKIKKDDIENMMRYDAIKAFITHFSNLSNSEVKERFEFFWNNLNVFYNIYNGILSEKNIAYEGALIKDVVREIISGKIKFSDKFYFVGFNALTKQEELVIDYLLKNHSAKIFWKYNDDFFSNEHNQGGKLLLSFIKKWNGNTNSKVISTSQSIKKNIKILSTSTEVGQVKYCTKILSQIPPDEISKTLVLLSDESLLNPFLNSIPDNINGLNVTMGLSIKQTQFWSLLNAYFKVLTTKKNGKIPVKFLTKFLNNNIIKIRYNDEYQKFYNELLDSNSIYYESNKDDSKLKKLLISIAKFEYLNYGQLIAQIESHFQKIFLVDENLQSEESIIAYAEFSRFFRRFKNLHQNNTMLYEDVDLKFAVLQLKSFIGSISLAFQGEPLEGLQVMGALETRALDFKNVIILSLNEGVFPNTSQRPTLVPYSLKKAFSLPTFETQEAIFTHHFYSLISGAENIHAIYYEKGTGVGNAEKSRFLSQLEYEKENKQFLNIENYNLSFRIFSQIFEPISFQLTPEERQNHFDKYKIDSESYISPSALINYMNCSLKYYFSNILRIREKEVIEDDLEKVDIGNVIHKVLEILINDYIQDSGKNAKNVYQKIDTTIDKVVKDEFRQDVEGYNFLMIEGIKVYITQVLDHLIKEQKINALKTEYNVKTTVSFKDLKINLGGKIDLLFEKGGLHYLFDYKSGKMPDKHNIPDDFELFQSDVNEYKHIFQMMFYLYLQYKNTGNLHHVSQLYYFIPKKVLTIGPLSQDIINQFESIIERNITEIFSDKNLFKQTDDEKKCLNCPYNFVCLRK